MPEAEDGVRFSKILSPEMRKKRGMGVYIMSLASAPRFSNAPAGRPGFQ